MQQRPTIPGRMPGGEEPHPRVEALNPIALAGEGTLMGGACQPR
jgi:hypothetical protein